MFGQSSASFSFILGLFKHQDLVVTPHAKGVSLSRGLAETYPELILNSCFF